MALGPPSIKTRGEFEAELKEAIYQADQHLAKAPHYAPMQVVRRQLEAMQKWTQGGRTPTPDERAKIQIGLIAAREFDDDEPLAELCHKLNYFFQEWPLAHGQ
jgi:hypothetical protein